MLLEQIQCKVCSEYAEVQIGTEQHFERLCFGCEEEKANEQNVININTWHCENTDCEAAFYTNLEDKPSHCPFCNGEELVDSKVLIAEAVNVNFVIK
jgi:hypothetical protein